MNSGGCLDFCHSISLADNLITDVEEIFKLSAIRSLRSLVVAGNPCNASGGELNRSRIVKAFEGRLRNLDGVDCSSLASIDQAVKECMFQDAKGGQVRGFVLAKTANIISNPILNLPARCRG